MNAVEGQETFEHINIENGHRVGDAGGNAINLRLRSDGVQCGVVVEHQLLARYAVAQEIGEELEPRDQHRQMFDEVFWCHRRGESSAHLFRNGDEQVVERTEISEDDLRVHRDLFADGAGRDFLDRRGQNQVDHGLN